MEELENGIISTASTSVADTRTHNVYTVDYMHEPGSSIATGYVFSIRKCTDTVIVSPDRSDDMFLLTLIQSHVWHLWNNYDE